MSNGVKVKIVKKPDDYATRYSGYEQPFPRYVTIAIVEAGELVLYYNGHYDVVPASAVWSADFFKPVIVDSKLYGRGTSDIKGGAASILEALVVLSELEAKLEHKVTLSLLPVERLCPWKLGTSFATGS